jgi:fumarate hydratase, class II
MRVMTDVNEQAPKILDLPTGLDATGMRQEFDGLGTAEVPADRYWASV